MRSSAVAGRAGRRSPLVLSIVFLLTVPAGAFADEECGENAAQVVSLGGAAWAQAPGEDRRALTCDDVVKSCETVITAPGSRVGLLSDDVYTLLGGDSQVVARRGDAGTTLDVKTGSLRVIDARAGDDAALQLRTRDAILRASDDSDAEITVLVEPTGTYTRVCSLNPPSASGCATPQTVTILEAAPAWPSSSRHAAKWGVMVV